MSIEPIDDGGPAYPSHDPQGMERWAGLSPVSRHENGMTLRDYFAGQALVGLCTDYEGLPDPGEWNYDGIARNAYTAADAMLRARKAVQP